MHDNSSSSKRIAHPTPSADHRRQMVWQVWVPLVASIVIVLALAIWSIIGAVQGSPQIDKWGAVSAILVIMPVLVAGLVIMVIVGGIAFGLTKLLKKMPEWMLKLQLIMVRVALVMRRAGDAATKPVIKTNTVSARVSTFWNRVIRRQAAH